MAGSILGADQVAKVNDAYPRLLRHLSDLLSADMSAYGLMKVHFLTEYLDTTELAAIFAGLTFLSPAEKRALVRAAIYDILAHRDWKTTDVPETYGNFIENTDGRIEKREEATFTPPAFKLNVNTASDFHPRAADINVAAPKVTSTHTSKVAQDVEAANKRMTEHQAKLDAAVAKLRASTQPKPIDIAPTPEVAIDIPQTVIGVDLAAGPDTTVIFEPAPVEE